MGRLGAGRSGLACARLHDPGGGGVPRGEDDGLRQAGAGVVLEAPMNRIVKIAFRERPESVFCTTDMTADEAATFLELISNAMKGIAL